MQAATLGTHHNPYEHRGKFSILPYVFAWQVMFEGSAVPMAAYFEIMLLMVLNAFFHNVPDISGYRLFNLLV